MRSWKKNFKFWGVEVCWLPVRELPEWVLCGNFALPCKKHQLVLHIPRRPSQRSGELTPSTTKTFGESASCLSLPMEWISPTLRTARKSSALEYAMPTGASRRISLVAIENPFWQFTTLLVILIFADSAVSLQI